MASVPTLSGIAPTRPVKHSFTLSGHRTSISLEAAFWDALRSAAAAERLTLSQLVGRIDKERGAAGLSSAVRVWILDYVRSSALRESADDGEEQ